MNEKEIKEKEDYSRILIETDFTLHFVVRTQFTRVEQKPHKNSRKIRQKMYSIWVSFLSRFDLELINLLSVCEDYLMFYQNALTNPRTVT